MKNRVFTLHPFLLSLSIIISQLSIIQTTHPRGLNPGDAAWGGDNLLCQFLVSATVAAADIGNLFVTLEAGHVEVAVAVHRRTGVAEVAKVVVAVAIRR